MVYLLLCYKELLIIIKLFLNLNSNMNESENAAANHGQYDLPMSGVA